jgi:hypothetical protein
MATELAITVLPGLADDTSIRSTMEKLLFDFYSVVGIAPRRGYLIVPGELLADSFQARFFIQATSELLCFDKQQMLTAKVSGNAQRPGSQLLSMNLVHDDNGCISVSYVAAFRHGQTATVRRGAFQAVDLSHGWQMRSLDEDVRVILMPEPRKYLRTAPDQPRVWIR